MEIKDASGNYVGYIYGNGKVHDASGNYVGYVYGSGKVEGPAGRYAGYVYGGGKLHNASDNYSGDVYGSGKVEDESGSPRGYVEGVAGTNITLGGGALLILLALSKSNAALRPAPPRATGSNSAHALPKQQDNQ